MNAGDNYMKYTYDEPIRTGSQWKQWKREPELSKKDRCPSKVGSKSRNT